jgi:hypothetical protein
MMDTHWAGVTGDLAVKRRDRYGTVELPLARSDFRDSSVLGLV